MSNFKRFQKQVDIGNEIAEKLQNNDSVILCAPTGSMKSSIGRFVHESMRKMDETHSSLVLMHQKVLIDQYDQLFSEFKDSISIKGKDNYECRIFPELSVQNAVCQFKPECVAKKHCEYFIKRKKAIKFPFVISNYQLVFSLIDIGFFDFAKDLCIYDECHNLEDLFTSYRICTINNNDEKIMENFCDFTERKNPDFYDIGIKILNSYKKLSPNKIEKKFSEIFSMRRILCDTISKWLTSDKIDELYNKNKSHIERYNNFLLHEERMLCKWENYQDTKNNTNYVSDFMHNDKIFDYSLTPIQVNKMFPNFITNISKKNLFMSATLDKGEQFMKRLGLEDTKYEFIEIDSEFNIENRRVYFFPLVKMNYTTMKNEKEMKPMYEMIKGIISKHNNESGVIFTPSYSFTEDLAKRLENFCDKLGYTLMYNLNTKERDEVLQDFYDINRFKKRLLISPSFYEGVNFSDDISRFAIIPKMFFKSLASKYVKEKMNIDPYWYSMTALMQLIQASGRSVRNKNDKATTYILDTNALNVFKRYGNYVPNWFIEGSKIFKEK